jgi:hypothetical protein
VLGFPVIVNKKIDGRNSERNPTMPRASESRASNATPGICFAVDDPATQHSKFRSNPSSFPHNTLSRPPIPSATVTRLNRQIHELELDVICRKTKDCGRLKSPKNQKMPERVFDRFSICANSTEELLNAPTENEF